MEGFVPPNHNQAKQVDGNHLRIFSSRSNMGGTGEASMFLTAVNKTPVEEKKGKHLIQEGRWSPQKSNLKGNIMLHPLTSEIVFC